MVDRPILFSAPMVRALLAGTKTQTRRVLKPQPKTFLVDGRECDVAAVQVEGEPVPRIATGRVLTAQKVRFAIGDRLWVKETWTVGGVYTDVIETRYRAHERASHTEFVERIPVDRVGKLTRARWPKYASPLYMPRWASRLTLIVTDVRVERLQDISEADARAEGCAPLLVDGFVECGRRKTVYRSLWDSINGAGAWDKNPWVVAVSFEVVPGNIDCPSVADRHPPP